MVERSLVSRITGWMVKVLFYVGILACAAVPFFYKQAGKFFEYPEALYLPLGVVILLTGIFGVYILFQLKSIFASIEAGNPFVMRNVSALRKMAVASALVVFVYAAKCLFAFTVSSGLIAIVFGVASLFCLTLKDVFKQAVLFKEENDLTV